MSQSSAIASLISMQVKCDRVSVYFNRDNLTAKFWLQSVSLAQNIGFPAKELRKLQSMVIENQTQLLEAWYEYFGD